MKAYNYCVAFLQVCWEIVEELDTKLTIWLLIAIS